MKKLLAAVLALCMMLSLASALADGTDVTGVWYASQMGDGETFVDIAMYGVSLTLSLNENGTAAMDYGDGEPEEGSWTMSDGGLTVTIADEAIQGTLADDELTLAQDGQVIIFTREAPAAMEFAEAKADAVLEDYNGTYVCAYVKNGDTYLPMETAAQFGLVLPGVTIENGAVSFENLETDEAGIGTMMNLFAGQPLELQDGQLRAEISLGEGSGTSGMIFTLLQDGMLNMNLVMDEESMFELYYTPAEGAAE